MKTKTKNSSKNSSKNSPPKKFTNVQQARKRTMTTEYPEGIAKAWVCYEILRRLGFDARDILVRLLLVSHGTAFGTIAQVVRVELNVQDKKFGYHAFIWTDEPEEFEKLWDKFGDELVARTLPDKLLHGWMTQYGPELEGIADMIMAKGIQLPIIESMLREEKEDGKQ